MNPTDIHGMALALGLPSALAQIEAVKQLVDEAVANEREACAKLADEYATYGGSNFYAWFKKLSTAIRARGNA